MNKTMRIAFFDTKPYDREYFERVAKTGEFGGISFEFDFFEGHLDIGTASLAAGHKVVCIFVNDHVDRAVADKLVEGGVELIALRCAGYNNVDLEAVWQRMHVVRVPAYSPHAVAEHAIALLQTLNRRTHTAYNRTRDGNFTLTGLVGRDLYGKTAGIIGTGKIGKILATILRGFGMNVVLDDLYPDQAFAESIGARYVDREELYRTSDVISLHCPLTPENTHMINEQTLALMKPGVILINTGRGGLIDSKALVDALKDGRIRGAGLDVYEEEDEYFFEDRSLSPIRDDVLARLIQFPNVLLTSHQAFLTEEALGEIARVTLSNVALWENEDRAPNEICYQCSAHGKKGECAHEKGQLCWPKKSA
jgi:D-lactate dehydrogenase